MRPPNDADFLEHFQWRVIQDALTEAGAASWLRQAERFEWARPRLGEHRGTDIDPRTRIANDRHLAGVASACRARATNPHIRTEEEQQIIDHVLPTAPPDFEPVDLLIRRIQHTIAAGAELLPSVRRVAA